jgi:hypothetical protein
VRRAVYPLIKEARAAYAKEWRKANRQQLLFKKAYYEGNRSRALAKSAAWIKHRLKRDPKFGLVHALRHHIRMAIRAAKTAKTNKTIDLVGCTWTCLKRHIGRQFAPGMAWDNYGKWHIDHIVPYAAFDLSKESEQRKCFHYTNLQPLWSHHNLAKGKKLDYRISVERVAARAVTIDPDPPASWRGFVGSGAGAQIHGAACRKRPKRLRSSAPSWIKRAFSLG